MAAAVTSLARPSRPTWQRLTTGAPSPPSGRSTAAMRSSQAKGRDPVSVARCIFSDAAAASSAALMGSPKSRRWSRAASRSASRTVVTSCRKPRPTATARSSMRATPRGSPPCSAPAPPGASAAGVHSTTVSRPLLAPAAAPLRSSPARAASTCRSEELPVAGVRSSASSNARSRGGRGSRSRTGSVTPMPEPCPYFKPKPNP
mmetsp:Transcript_873/g.2353  ORF Transcript_873/g.2353 Transcript_873/m.2353 type:complete len:203 (-) Transcript_873:199-807(-)